MIWTTQRPNKQGWHWWRPSPCNDEIIVYLFFLSNELNMQVNGSAGIYRPYTTGEWSDTCIAEPGEAT